MGDHVVFIMPEDVEGILWAVPVLISYLVQRGLEKRMPEKITTVCSWEEGYPWLKNCWKGMQVVPSIQEVDKENLDFLFEFDPEKEFILTEKFSRHIVDSYSLHLGTFPQVKFPPVPEKLGVGRRSDVLVVGRTWMEKGRNEVWKDANRFVTLGEKQGLVIKNLPQATWEQLREEISGSSVVVGVRGVATLMAASIGRVVMDLYPKDKTRFWATKWETGRYAMFYKDLDQITADEVWERLQSLLGYLAGRKQWASHQAPILAPEPEERLAPTV